MRDFYKRVITIALPVAVQQLISTSVNFVDTIMIGRLGEYSIAAVGLSNKIFFLYILVLFGLTSGGSIFISQFWGKKEEENISKTTALITFFSLIASVIFLIPSLFFTEFTLQILTPDYNVVSLGKNYLPLMSLSFPILAFSLVFETVLKATEKTIIPMYTSMIAMGSNIFLNYIFIFGKLGLPVMGVKGAALGTLFARIIQLIIIFSIIYFKKHHGTFSINDIKQISFKYIKHFLKVTIPTTAQEFFWALGFTTYAIIYSYMGTNIIAARSVMETIENVAFTILIAVSNATAILVGKDLGASLFDRAIQTAKRLLILNTLLAILMGIGILIIRNPILIFFNVSEEVKILIRQVLLITAFFIPIKTINLMNVVGILRAGGDTKFSFLIELFTLWGFGIPIAFITGIILGFSFPVVYLFTLGEECLKAIIMLKRYRSKKWAKNVVDNI